jgi:hypothetical protein
MRHAALILFCALLGIGCWGGDDEKKDVPPTPAPAPVEPTPIPTPTPTPRPTKLELGEGFTAEVLEWGAEGDGAAKGDTVTVALRILAEDDKPVWQGTMELELESGEGYAGLDRTVSGMTVGAKRRAAVPPDFAWKNDDKSAGKHTLEVELIRLEKAGTK